MKGKLPFSCQLLSAQGPGVPLDRHPIFPLGQVFFIRLETEQFRAVPAVDSAHLRLDLHDRARGHDLPEPGQRNNGLGEQDIYGWSFHLHRELFGRPVVHYGKRSIILGLKIRSLVFGRIFVRIEIIDSRLGKVYIFPELDGLKHLRLAGLFPGCGAPGLFRFPTA